ncbi:hydrogen gas-evolving membrane-bound hydrogenase subunit E [Haliangium sp.]|uniref:hydrogen gas-evolving membrane-bound hydrogenase subunit E n=1 Tax=Haliangium sp. TaxID=2663208 RepID=UPI003D12556F
MMVIGVLVLFGLALAAPWLARVARGHTAWLLALAPLALLVHFALLSAGADAPARESYPWLPGLGVELAFAGDGLALLFAILITGVGAPVMVYAGGYLAGAPGLGRFCGYLLFFMGAMLGLVLSDDLVTLFVFWELTSVASYLLIGFGHEREAARKAARRALVVTGAGGLALLCGVVLIMRAAGELGAVEVGRISTLAALPLRDHGLYTPAVILILVGAFAKSAQVPFHFWLPGAMAAPTPVSAYLHSATMVKAGVFLIARLTPALGDTALWQVTITITGALTMLTGAYLATRQRDLKRVLAYSTVSVLGIATMLLGLGGERAIEAAVVFLVAHALYKAALFMVAGNLDHETGTRDIGRLGGLRRLLPVTCAAGVVAALSKAGAPPLFGFLGKELLYATQLGLGGVGLILVVVAVAANVALVATALLVGVAPFFGPRRQTPRDDAGAGPHEAPLSMLLGPVALAGLGVFVGIVPGAFDTWLGAPAASAIVGRPVAMELALWHGINPEAVAVMALSALTLVLGWALYRALARRRRGRPAGTGAAPTAAPEAATPGPIERAFEAAVDGLPKAAGHVARAFAGGYLHRDLYAILIAVVALVVLASASGWGEMWAAVQYGPGPRPHEWIWAGLVVAGALAACVSSSRLAAAAALGVSGLGIALVFAAYGAPDLAITLIMVETLTVLLLVLVLYHLPPFKRHSGARRRGRDAAIAVAVGAVMTALTLASAAVHLEPSVAEYYAQHSLSEAHGRNVVNVILVDFRALDTLGEIVVVALSGIGVVALLARRRSERPASALDEPDTADTKEMRS